MPRKKKEYRKINQSRINEEISKQLGLDRKLVDLIIGIEQELTLLYLRRNYKVSKRGYMTLTPIVKGEYELKSYFDQKIYNIPSQPLIRISVGRTVLEELKLDT